MLRLKKEKPAEPAPAAVAAPVATSTEMDVSPPAEASADAGSAEAAAVAESGAAAPAGGSISLLGVGGQQIRAGEERRGGKKMTPGELRIRKDIAELDGGNAAKVDFPNPNDLTSFVVTVKPDTGYWSGARYVFNFSIHADYPHKAPKVLCTTKIYHPNIDLDGNVCLNILKEDWKPVLDINAVIYGLVYLFYEPNPDDPLNREAAELYRNDRTQFQRIVRRTLEGHSHGSVVFERLV